ncbi:RNA polymerase sigma factor [Puteibacter caeruleilacunae]|nr:RNA polymerase sigma factor [Puteibacter caeruleilacunae]
MLQFVVIFFQKNISLKLQHISSYGCQTCCMNETDLIKQILNGNTNAFGYLVNQHRQLVYHMVIRIVQQKEDAEDICQEVFIKVFKNINKFRGDAKLSTWIASIAYNVCINYLKKNNRYQKEELVGDYLGFEKSFADTNNPEDVINKKELKQAVLNLVERLPVKYRTVVTLYHLEDFSYKEIEEITKYPEGTVKNYIHRARGLLKREIEGLMNNDYLKCYEELRRS